MTCTKTQLCTQLPQFKLVTTIITVERDEDEMDDKLTRKEIWCGLAIWGFSLVIGTLVAGIIYRVALAVGERFGLLP